MHVAEGEAAVHFGLLSVFGCEPGFEFVERVDFASVCFAVRQGALEEIGLNLGERVADVGDELARGTPAFSEGALSRRAMKTASPATSRGPTSRRMGTPRLT